MVWQVGEGRVIYIRPGHETYPIYKDANMLRIMENAVRSHGAAATPVTRPSARRSFVPTANTFTTG